MGADWRRRRDARAGIPVAGCGDDPDSSDERRTFADASETPEPAPSTEPTEDIPGEEPAVANAAWVDALANHDAAAACALQAPEFTIDLRYEAILGDRAELGDPCTGFEAILWEDAEFESEIVDVSATEVTQEDVLLDVQQASRALTVRIVYHRAGAGGCSRQSIAPRVDQARRAGSRPGAACRRRRPAEDPRFSPAPS